MFVFVGFALAHWLRDNLTGRTLLARIPPKKRDEFLTQVEDAARPHLYRDGG